MSEKIRILVESTTLVIPANGQARLGVTIENSSSSGDRYQIELQGLPPGWAHVEPGIVALQPGERGQATIVASPPAGAPLGSYPCLVRAVSEQNPAEATGLGVVFDLQAAPLPEETPAPQPAPVWQPPAPVAQAQDEPMPIETQPLQASGGGFSLPESPQTRTMLAAVGGLLALLVCILGAMMIRSGPGEPSTPTPTVELANAFDCANPVISPVTPVVLQAGTEPITTTVPAEAGLPAPAIPVLAGGFMDLPIPYDGGNISFGGTAGQFRRAANRIDIGGNVTSFFDHEFPLYPWVFRGLKFYGKEPAYAPVKNSVLIYDGVRLSDDWYTGHPGYDLAPVRGFRNSTPVFAAGDGIVRRVAVYNDGNHFVEIRHPVEGVGDYLTSYLHLQNDAYWAATRTRIGQAIRAGERIGTMGNTGKSTGTHLHFEVQFDANRDGQFDASERVDPFGFAGSDRPDPWGQDTVLVDYNGRELSHKGVASRYLWQHPLGVTAPVGDSAGRIEVPRGGGDETGGLIATCPPADTLPANCSLVAAWSPDTRPDEKLRGTGNGCLVSAYCAESQPVTQFNPPLPVSIQYLSEDIQDVDPQSLAIYLMNASTGEWEPLPTSIDAERLIATAQFPRPGKCALMGKPARDLLAPRTTINLEGPILEEEENVYSGDVTVKMSAQDIGGSGGAVISYTLDFGSTWLRYTEPFVVPAETAPPAEETEGEGETEAGGEDGLAQGEGDRMIMARAVDGAGNEEEPPAVVSFSIIAPGATITPTITAEPAIPTPHRTVPPPVTRTPTATPVVVVPNQPVVSIGVEPSQVLECACATMRWDADYVREVYLDGKGVVGHGSQEICPKDTKTYTLRAETDIGPIEKQATIKVLKPVINFSADKTALAPGECTKLRWDVSNIREVYVDGKGVTGQGSKEVCWPAAAAPVIGDQTHTLAVVTDCGRQERQVVIKLRQIQVQVTDVSASVSPGSSDDCQARFQFTGKITLNGAGTVSYQ